jgi:hypothetical protein
MCIGLEGCSFLLRFCPNVGLRIRNGSKRSRGAAGTIKSQREGTKRRGGRGEAAGPPSRLGSVLGLELPEPELGPVDPSGENAGELPGCWGGVTSMSSSLALPPPPVEDGVPAMTELCGARKSGVINIFCGLVLTLPKVAQKSALLRLIIAHFFYFFI